MSNRTSAARYARALFDVALAESDVEQVDRDLTAVVETVRGHDELAQILANPGVPEQARRNIVAAIVERLGVTPPVAKLVALLAARGRADLLPDLASVYRDRLRAHQNVVEAEVVAAAPLAADAQAALGESLAAATGKQVTMSVAVDPALLGGVVARVGSTVYDGSVRTQLKKMRDRLVAEG